MGLGDNYWESAARVKEFKGENAAVERWLADHIRAAEAQNSQNKINEEIRKSEYQNNFKKQQEQRAAELEAKKEAFHQHIVEQIARTKLVVEGFLNEFKDHKSIENLPHNLALVSLAIKIIDFQKKYDVLFDSSQIRDLNDLKEDKDVLFNKLSSVVNYVSQNEINTWIDKVESFVKKYRTLRSELSLKSLNEKLIDIDLLEQLETKWKENISLLIDLLTKETKEVVEQSIQWGIYKPAETVLSNSEQINDPFSVLYEEKKYGQTEAFEFLAMKTLDSFTIHIFEYANAHEKVKNIESYYLEKIQSALQAIRESYERQRALLNVKDYDKIIEEINKHGYSFANIGNPITLKKAIESNTKGNLDLFLGFFNLFLLGGGSISIGLTAKKNSEFAFIFALIAISLCISLIVRGYKKKNTIPMVKPLAQSTLSYRNTESKNDENETQSSSDNLLEEGYLHVSEYAKSNDTFPVHVINDIKAGKIEGKNVNGEWYIKE